MLSYHICTYEIKLKDRWEREMTTDIICTVKIKIARVYFFTINHC